jgi:uncharacterized membrane protein (DUF4010 family)
MAQQAMFPLLLIPVLLALGLAVSPSFMLRLIGWFIAVNLLLVGCILVAQAPRAPSSSQNVRTPAEALPALKQGASPERPVGKPPR